MFKPQNFRDLGECLALIMDEEPPIPVGLIFRGGKFDSLTHHQTLGHPASIINLRSGPDPTHLEGVGLLHFPSPDSIHNYHTERPSTQAWMRGVFEALVDPEIPWPIYLHCTAGKDRTGVIVAAILALLDLREEVIVEEFLLSDDVEEDNIRHALAGLKSIQAHWMNANALKRRLQQARAALESES